MTLNYSKLLSLNMIHGLCGSPNNKAPSMKDDNCCKRYPRPRLRETQGGDDGYPQYNFQGEKATLRKIPIKELDTLKTLNRSLSKFKNNYITS